MENKYNNSIAELNWTFTLNDYDAIESRIDNIESDLRADGFVPFRKSLKPSNIKVNENWVDGHWGWDVELHCYLAYVGKRLARVIPMVKDEVELEKIIKIAKDL